MRKRLVVGIILMMTFASGEKQYVQVQKGLLSIKLKDAELTKVLKEIGRQAKIEVRIDKSVKGKITAEFTDIPLEEGLKRLIKGKDWAMVFTKISPPNLPKKYKVKKLYIAPRGSEEGLPKGGEEKLKGWNLAFEGGELGKDWTVIKGDWQIVNGKLTCTYGPGVLVLNKNLGNAGLRIEYDCTAGDDPCDLSCFIGESLNKGYFIGFGSNWNTQSKILRLGKLRAINNSFKALIIPNKTHHFIAEKFGNTVSLSIDGESVLEVEDPDIIPTNTVGLYIWSEGCYDNLKIYTQE